MIAYGVTSCESRMNGLLRKTLDSLKLAGFDKPRLFIDGVKSAPLPLKNEYDVTCRYPALRTYSNWWMAAWELYLREPHAELFAIFQDDLIAVRNLRQYLEEIPYPRGHYLNLYTFPQNEKPNQGFYLSNQRGLGAVGLVFDNATLRTLFEQRHMIDRPMSRNPSRPSHKFLDGAVLEALKNAGIREMVHSPSLIQHTGDVSSMGNRRHAKAKSFPGEEFDAMTLLKAPAEPKRVEVAFQPKTSKRNRIGLVGYSCATGLGELNRQIATFADVDRWLVKPHPGKGTAAHTGATTTSLHPDCETTVCPTGVKVRRWLNNVDSVVFAELPYYGNLVDLAKQMGKRVTCIPMHEWMPGGCRGWPRKCDLLLCPTWHCHHQFAHVCPSLLFPWPVDTDRFQFLRRTKCERFLFVNGTGGWGGRKGGAVIRAVCKLWPEIPLTVVSQKNEKWPAGVKVVPPPKSNSDLYKLGDVLLYPSSVDGLGLQPMEAMASGMPVIATDGLPWRENEGLDFISAYKGSKTVNRPVDWWSPSSEHLAKLCRKWIGKDISEASDRAFEWSRLRSWSNRAEEFNALVRGEAVSHLDPANRHPNRCIDSTPYISEEATAKLKTVVEGKRVLEVGSGSSTVWLEKHAESVVSLEDAPAWHAAVSAKVSSVDLRLVSDLLDQPEGFDVAFVDCVEDKRGAALQVAAKNLPKSGVLVADDADFPCVKEFLESLNGEWDVDIVRGKMMHPFRRIEIDSATAFLTKQ